MAERKKRWKYFKPYLEEDTSIDRSDIKHYRDFFVLGKIPPPKRGWFDEDYTHLPSIWCLHIIPCETIEDVKELLDSLKPDDDMVDRCWDFGWFAHVFHNKGLSGNQRRLIAQALYSGNYNDKKVLYQGTEWRVDVDPKRFVLDFEHLCYAYLRGPFGDPYAEGDIVVPHWVSCIRYLEEHNDLPSSEERTHLKLFLGRCLNFIEPREEPDSATMAKTLANTVVDLFESGEAPASLLPVWESLQPDGIIEHQVPLKSTEGRVAPSDRIVLGGDGASYAVTLVDCVKRYGFNDSTQEILEPQLVDIGAMISGKYKKYIGWGEEEHVPAYHRKEVKGSNLVIYSN
jgi:hypothetical protein